MSSAMKESSAIKDKWIRKEATRFLDPGLGLEEGPAGARGGGAGAHFLLDSRSGARISALDTMRSPRLEEVAGRAAPRRFRETPPGAKAEAEEAAAARRPAVKSGREKTMAAVSGRYGRRLAGSRRGDGGVRTMFGMSDKKDSEPAKADRDPIIFFKKFVYFRHHHLN